MSEKIGVLGCGWLGLPLAKALVMSSYSVKGTTTSNEKLSLLKDAGIDPFQISISGSKIEGNLHGFLADITILVINIPPRLRSGKKESFVAKIKLLHEAINKSSVSKVLFISSTSVYGDAQGEVTEKTDPKPTTLSGKQLWASEKLFAGDDNLRTTIIRFGGLIGPNRHPVNMLSGRKNLTNGHHPINLIHQEDCIRMITTIIEKKYWGELFNGVYPFHPSKKEYYIEKADQLGIPHPHYDDLDRAKSGKTIRSQNFLDKSHSFHTPIHL